MHSGIPKPTVLLHRKFQNGRAVVPCASHVYACCLPVVIVTGAVYQTVRRRPAGLPANGHSPLGNEKCNS